ncbi:MAG: hypothetical protein SH850_26750 [Planctomycetaceae bacterium]|nr:hypothetical protein [Planctomycetaceae bacterium]
MAWRSTRIDVRSVRSQVAYSLCAAMLATILSGCGGGDPTVAPAGDQEVKANEASHDQISKDNAAKYGKGGAGGAHKGR